MEENGKGLGKGGMAKDGEKRGGLRWKKGGRVKGGKRKMA